MSPRSIRHVLAAACLPLILSCPSVRRSGPPAMPARVPAEEQPAAPASSPAPAGLSRSGLAAGRLLLRLGWRGAADDLLEEAARAAAEEGNGSVEGQVLTLRAVVAWEAARTDQALDLLRAAASVDPAGSATPGALLALDLMRRVVESEATVDDLRGQLVHAQQRQVARDDEIAGLENELAALQRQLHELKQVHLQIESEKDDDPS